jgi:endonuclease/exonuclease/phosphatase family metal-dependent hydrolase
MRLINWNIERRGPHTWQAASLLSEMATLAPDIICLTEAHDTSCQAPGGHVLSHSGYRSANKKPSERLVLLWSRSPWEQLTVPDAIESAGGAVMGRTSVGSRAVTCLCLCIPYHMAKLPEEAVTRPWHHHDRFLRLAAPWLASLASTANLIIAGDFNRRMPRGWGPKKSYELLERAFSPFNIATTGPIGPGAALTIDHVAHSNSLKAARVSTRSRFETDGRPRSDHFGVVVDFDAVSAES